MKTNSQAVSQKSALRTGGLAAAVLALALFLMPERGAAQSTTSCTFDSPGCTNCGLDQVCEETRTGACVCAGAPSLASLVRQTAAQAHATLVAGVNRMACVLNNPPEPIVPGSGQAAPFVTVPHFAWALFSHLMEQANAGLLQPPEPVRAFQNYRNSRSQAERGAAQYAFEGPVDTKVTHARLERVLGDQRAALPGARELLLLVAAEAAAVQAVDIGGTIPPEPVCVQ